eukprot:TRINITY_DN1056_c0_g1_i3.p1 TRINITY_DN1056_c0_g1~~TRINITY_DN1056_c0_g1_i3.p1  ORF type:complete len:401 (+),score=106.56 TRINITY_DN1056_c0_g1_i3:298-1500(+)
MDNPKVDPNLARNGNFTPLYIASFKNNVRVVDILNHHIRERLLKESLDVKMNLERDQLNWKKAREEVEYAEKSLREAEMKMKEAKTKVIESEKKQEEINKRLMEMALENKVERVLKKRKNVILFGRSGAGKSSVINLVFGSNVANVRGGLRGVTSECAPYDDDVMGFRLWDTAGLCESDGGTVSDRKATEAVVNLASSLLKKGGLHLVVFVFNLSTPICEDDVKNYKKMEQFTKIEQKGVDKVPTVLCLTQTEEIELEEWWGINQEAFDKNGMKFDDVAAVIGIDPSETEMAEEYIPEFIERKEKLKVGMIECISKNMMQLEEMEIDEDHLYNEWIPQIIWDGFGKKGENLPKEQNLREYIEGIFKRNGLNEKKASQVEKTIRSMAKRNKASPSIFRFFG